MQLHPGYGFARDLSGFLACDQSEILGHLADHASRRRWGATEHQQIAAWTESLGWIAHACEDLIANLPSAASWHLCLEYLIPRRGSQIDCALLASELIFVVEFKSTTVDGAAVRQVEDYALELLDFHEDSHGRALFPIVCASRAEKELGKLAADWGVATVSTCTPGALGASLLELHHEHHDPTREPIDPSAWLTAPYRPTPTIIEAATALYSGHEVRDLSQSEASAQHLLRTQESVAQIVDESHSGRKIIGFVTGTPGAGKTLAGLNVVHHLPQDNHATFLSGNGPLVNVLQHVLADDLARRNGTSRAAGLRTAKTLVTNVHRWLDDYIDRKPDTSPHENVVVFDEAQRAWDRDQSMRKFRRDASEPEMMLEAMSRREQAVVIGLVGGGQEINTGEAGLSEWGRALKDRFTDWDIVISPELAHGNPVAGTALFQHEADVPTSRLRLDANLHLPVSQRSFRTQKLTEWVEAVLAHRWRDASLLMEELSRYPIVMTRDLGVAREWLRARTRGLRRCGILAGSGSRRLRPYGISVQERIKETDWFLRPSGDVRSSNFLELAISEFGIQGLEVDWACLAWGGDLYPDGDSWQIRAFRGTKWQGVHAPAKRAYSINRYRVLLTRAREGMVIWVPLGDPRDGTRDPRVFDSVFGYLSRCGVKTV